MHFLDYLRFPSSVTENKQIAAIASGKINKRGGYAFVLQHGAKELALLMLQ